MRFLLSPLSFLTWINPVCMNALLLQTEQMGRIVNDLDTIQFSIKKASQLVKEIGRQVCIF